jgi:hypothetical protein
VERSLRWFVFFAVVHSLSHVCSHDLFIHYDIINVIVIICQITLLGHGYSGRLTCHSAFCPPPQAMGLPLNRNSDHSIHHRRPSRICTNHMISKFHCMGTYFQGNIYSSVQGGHGVFHTLSHGILNNSAANEYHDMRLHRLVDLFMIQYLGQFHGKVGCFRGYLVYFVQGGHGVFQR